MATPKPTLMTLPIKVRKNIYSFIVPNKSIPYDFTHIEEGLHQKHDTAILRVNRQAHNEAIAEWYGAVTYQILLNAYGAKFLNQTYDMGLKELPRKTLSNIQSLEVVLHLSDNVVWRAEPGDSPLCPLVNILLGMEYQLRHLKLRLDPSFSRRSKKNAERLVKCMEWNLGSLRQLSRLSSLETEIEFANWASLPEYEDGFRQIVSSYVQELEDDINSKFDSKL